MAEKRDYYEILGVARDADESEIKIAFRRLALQMHPDTNREDPLAEELLKDTLHEGEPIQVTVRPRFRPTLLLVVCVVASVIPPQNYHRYGVTAIKNGRDPIRNQIERPGMARGSSISNGSLTVKASAYFTPAICPRR